MGGNQRASCPASSRSTAHLSALTLSRMRARSTGDILGAGTTCTLAQSSAPWWGCPRIGWVLNDPLPPQDPSPARPYIHPQTDPSVSSILYNFCSSKGIIYGEKTL